VFYQLSEQNQKEVSLEKKLRFVMKHSIKQFLHSSRHKHTHGTHNTRHSVLFFLFRCATAENLLFTRTSMQNNKTRHQEKIIRTMHINKTNTRSKDNKQKNKQKEVRFCVRQRLHTRNYVFEASFAIAPIVSLFLAANFAPATTSS